jgi:hypothetical protein
MPLYAITPRRRHFMMAPLMMPFSNIDADAAAVCSRRNMPLSLADDTLPDSSPLFSADAATIFHFIEPLPPLMAADS